LRDFTARDKVSGAVTRKGFGHYCDTARRAGLRVSADKLADNRRLTLMPYLALEPGIVAFSCKSKSPPQLRPTILSHTVLRL